MGLKDGESGGWGDGGQMADDDVFMFFFSVKKWAEVKT